MTAVLGANGAGKTSLLRTITGLVPAQRRRVKLDGEDITRLPVEEIVRRGLAHVPEGRGVITELTVEENLRLGGLWRGREAAPLPGDLRAVPAAARSAHGSRRRGCRAASGRCCRSAGRWWRGRARCCSTSRRSGWRRVLVAQIMALVRRLADTLGLAVLLVEQNARSALSIANRGVVLNLGRVVADQEPGRARRRRAPPPRLPGVLRSRRSVTKFIDLTLNGISTGAIYAAVALALVLIWRATRIVNFAQGAMLMITTFIASAVISSTGSYWLGLRGRAVVRAGARRGRRAGADPAGRERAAAERGDPHARAVHAAGRGRGDDLGQHAALVPGRVLDARLQGRRHDACCSPPTTRSSCWS